MCIVYVYVCIYTANTVFIHKSSRSLSYKLENMYFLFDFIIGFFKSI